jgi:hypothetical protein
MNITGKSLFTLNVLLSLFFEFQSFSQMTVDSIIAKHLEVSGLANSSDDIKTFSLEGEMVQNKIHFPLKINGILPDKLRMDFTYNNQNYVKIYNGDYSWDYNPTNDSVSTNINKKEESANFIERLTGGLYKYKSGLIKARLMGLVSIDDVELYKLEILEGKNVQIIYIDKLSYLILRIDDDIIENKLTYYNDYRKIGNYYLPFSLTSFESGLIAISMQFKSIAINPEINNELFDRPLNKR